MKTYKDLLIELMACKDAIEFVSNKTVEQANEDCHRGDWMLWVAKKVGVPLKELTLAKGHCANTVRHLMKDERSIAGVDAAIAFGNGEITEVQLSAAADAAADAATAAAADAAAYAAYAAAADAAYAAAYAAAAAREKNRKLTADICRKYIGKLIEEKVNELLTQPTP